MKIIRWFRFRYCYKVETKTLRIERWF